MGTEPTIDHDQELDRIRRSYEERDGWPRTVKPDGWETKPYRFYLQEIEWQLLSLLSRASAPLAGGSVLEVGCGSGYFLNRFIEYGAACGSGIDLMPARAAQAKGRYPHLDVVVGDASRLPWQDGTFDVVAQFTCLSSILDPTMRAAVASEMWRVTRPGGAIVSFDMCGSRSFGLRRQSRKETSANRTAVETPTVPIPVSELRRYWPDPLCFFTKGLSSPAAALSSRGRWIATVAANLPALRTHFLVVTVKPL
jgi:SAM-dependent methyltransferase